MRPLTKLTGSTPWVWEGKQQAAFDELKVALTQYPVLRIPIDDGPFKVECDSSDYVNGAILSQCINERWHLVAYRSRTLSEMERNYEIHDKIGRAHV